MKEKKLEQAIEKVMTGKMSIRQAAEMFGVSKSTLAYHVQKAKEQQKQQKPVSHETGEMENEGIQNQNEFENDVDNELAMLNLEIENLQREKELLEIRIKELEKELQKVKTQKAQNACEIKAFLNDANLKCYDVIKLWRVIVHLIQTYFKKYAKQRRKTKYYMYIAYTLFKKLKENNIKVEIDELKFSKNIENFMLFDIEQTAKARQDAEMIKNLDQKITQKFAN